jgi:hypothetical protein
MKDDEIRSWFSSHEAKYSLHGEIELLRWKKPASVIYSITYLRRNGTLFVDGDLGAATYKWGQCVDLEWISQCNLDYFANKCLAREGRHYIRQAYDYDAYEAIEDIERIIKEHAKEAEECGKPSKPYVINYDDFGSEYELSKWGEQNGYEILGDAWYEYEIGKIIAISVRAHLLGIKMAMEYLRKTSI